MVRSAVKVIAGKEYCVAGDFYGALDKFVNEAIEKARTRAVENGRVTLKPQDL